MQRLQAQMNQIAITHMNEVRKTLSDFREAFEKRTLFLRNCNAEFLKACRDELQQLSDKITQKEAEVLGHLETKEREQKVLIERLLRNFSDIFRVHLTDLIYLEGMARCLRRAQTQIKAEIADSSSQGRKLQEHLDAMEASMRDLAQLPTFLPSEKNEPLNAILQAYSELVTGASHRCIYLGCLKMQASSPASAGIDISAEHPPRPFKHVKSLEDGKQFYLAKLAKEVRANVSRAGRPAHDDSSVKLLQALLHQPKTQDLASPVVNSGNKQNAAAADAQGMESADIANV
ncbi:unnamed protein product [Dibothriocephalus latus]|uniref:Uncharacterized protein n=1 Tax=Dibothriocephalus latus TaxID=60516 RepID=A0A3P7P1K2_DIBLA|nr:unnamed protein product [Dibothriocephalus latus]